MALRVGDYRPTQRITIAKPYVHRKLKVVNNYGMQGSSYNPQRTAPARYVQKATPPRPIQGSAPALQSRNNVRIQQAATRAQIQAAVIEQKLRVAAEVARQKEVRRVQVQGKLDDRVDANQSTFKLRAGNAQTTARLSLGRNYYPGKISVPNAPANDPEFERIRQEAKEQAMRLVDQTKSYTSTGWFGNLLDKATFGADRRASGARKYAEEQANSVADRQVKVYEGKLDAHNKLQATLQADYEAKKLRLSAAELNALADQYNAKLSNSVQQLRHIEAYTVGTVEGYGFKAEEKIKSKGAAAAGFINRNIVQKVGSNPIWKYTLGEGSENLPSVVTAPSRAINLIGNLNTKDRNIYKYGGETAKRTETKKNAWQSTFNQRNFNIRPVTDLPFNRQAAIDDLKKNSAVYTNKLKNAKSDADREEILKKYWDNKNRSARNTNSAQEVAADPLNFLYGAGAILRSGKAAKLAKAGRASKYTSAAFKAFDKVTETKNAFKTKAANNKVIKWLGSEAKSPEEALQDAIQKAKQTQGVAQNELLPRLASIDKKISGGKLDLGVFDDLGRLTDSEAKILQRMNAGKLTARDRLMLAGKNYKTTRETLERISARWDEFSENMRLADNVKTSRFGKGKKTYSPRTVWTQGDLSQYNFRLKRGKGVQSGDDFTQGAIDRYIKSDIRSQSKAGKSRLTAERDELLKRYDDTVNASRNTVSKAERRAMKLGKYFNIRKNGGKIEGISAGRAAFNSARSLTGAPTRLWKKSVLKYRPAWTVNNVAYNTQAGVLSGGLGYLPEQAKMLNPRYARKAMDSVPASVKSDLAKEIGGKGRLNKFYSGVENNPRVAAFRALKKKGLSDKEALKRVDKYFFNYKTKNWERPLKTVMPFWAWQKNLTKAAAQMPFDRPGYAIAYNRIDRQQSQAFEKDFETVVPQLKEYGYSDKEIEAFKQEQAKYYKGRLKVGSKYFNTPFHAFSEKGLTSMGFNPYLTTAGEFSESQDSFGRTTKGMDSSFARRLSTKFPQADLGYEHYKGWRVDKGLDKPSVKYIGKAGSQGYGLTKEKQGHDPSAPNYVANLDPRTKTKQDISAFLGKPRVSEFDKGKFLESKKLQKVTAEYFSKSEGWKDMDYDTSTTEQAKLFKKYGMTPDDFFKGILAKYDSEHAKKVKGLKEAAAKQNKSLFDEYGKQPQGTRNVWATDKLRELTKAGYFNDNPFLKSFKWVNRDTAKKADKQKAVQYALRTGDWSAYRKIAGTTQKQLDYQKAKKSGDWAKYTKKYGVKSEKAKAYRAAEASGDWTAYRKAYGTTAKAAARDKAVATGDWTAYRKAYGTDSKESPYQYKGKYFKTAQSMEKYKEGEFWREYIEADKTERKRLLAMNPKYDRRRDWTDEQWDEWKVKDKAKKLAALKNHKTGGMIYNRHLAQNKRTAYLFRNRGKVYRSKKLAYR